MRDHVLGLHKLAASISVQDWIALVLGSADESKRDRRIPALPPADIQVITNNLHGRKTLEGAAKLYAFVAGEVRSRLPASQPAQVLDFGCGWGRFARFFAQLTDETNIHGVDVDARLIEACREFLQSMNFSVIVPRRPLPFADNAFDFVFSNSVFSHLNEEAHRFYIGEIGRCTRPGGLLIATTLGPAKMRGMYRNGKEWPASVTGPLDKVEQELNAGKFVFGSSFRLADYGLAFLPDHWTTNNWVPHFDVVDVKTNFSQDVNVALRRN